MAVRWDGFSEEDIKILKTTKGKDSGDAMKKGKYSIIFSAELFLPLVPGSLRDDLDLFTNINLQPSPTGQ